MVQNFSLRHAAIKELFLPMGLGKQVFIEHEAREIMHLVASVRLSVRPFVWALTVEPFDLRPSSFAWRSLQVYVSVISGCMRIIVRMRSIGF